MTTKAVNDRELALGILLLVTEQGDFIHESVRLVLDKYRYLDKKDRAFIQRLAEGTVERMVELDYILDAVSNVKTEKMKPVIRNLLRMSVYQLLYMDKVPASAVCNEAVKLAGKKGFHNLKGFVNGVLRGVIKSLPDLSWPGMEEPARCLSVRYSMPLWIAELWLGRYGAEVTERMLAGLLEQRPLSIRCNESRIATAELIKKLEQAGLTVHKSPLLPYALTVEGLDTVRDLPGFAEGQFFVQDVASMLVAEAAAPAAGMRILDVCAAPGGKILHLADKLKGAGELLARDVSAQKVERIEENMRRGGFLNVTARVWDALTPDDALCGQVDMLIADLPCSGLGVIAKKSDIKYRVKAQDLDSLADLQRRMLAVAQSYVKPGGLLLYSTCTVSAQENEENVRWFMECYPFRTESVAPYMPAALQEAVDSAGCLQLLPGVHGADGFFIARLRREGGV